MYQASCFGYQMPHDYKPDPRFVVVQDGETFERAVREIGAQPAFAFDFETSGLAWYQHACACGLALGYVRPDGAAQNFYIPFRHAIGRQLELPRIGGAIKALLENPALKIGHNLKFDFHIAIREGWHPRGPLYDTMIGAQFYDENRALALKERAHTDLRQADAGYWEALVAQEVHRLAKQQRTGYEAYLFKYGYSQLPIELCGIYACHDTEYTLGLWKFYEQYGISRYYPRVWQTEQELIRVLVDMEHSGVYVDAYYLEQLRRKLAIVREGLGNEIRGWVRPYDVEIGSDESLRHYLQSVLRIPLYKLTKTGKLSVDREVLEEFKDRSPVMPLILQWRDAEKIGSTYTGSILERLDSNSMLHCNFQQVGTNTGRLACREPNLQNIPTDDNDRAVLYSGKGLKEGGVDPWSVKRAFKVPNGSRRLFADYSQIELRVLAYYSGDAIMREVYLANGDIHTRTSLEVFGTDDELMRRRAKVINFGLSYCMSGKGLSRQTKMGEREADVYLAKFFERYAGVAKFRPYFWQRCRQDRNQFVNLFGRPRRVPLLTSRDSFERGRAERQAIGSLIQGTASELTKESLVRLHQWIKTENIPAQLRLTIHDEIQLDVDLTAVETVAAKMKELMQNYPEFAPIPITVDVSESATNWAEKAKRKSPE